MITDPFRNLLLPGERIVWSGQPGQGIVITVRDIMISLFGGLILAIGLLFVATMPDTSTALPTRIFGFGLTVYALYIVAGRLFVDVWMRKSMWYALTDRRILIHRGRGGLRALDLATLGPIANARPGAARGTIRFGEDEPILAGRRIGTLHASRSKTPQFIAIQSPAVVFDLVIKQTIAAKQARAA